MRQNFYCSIGLFKLHMPRRSNGLFRNSKFQNIYGYAPHNDVSVNDGPHIRQWSHNIQILTNALQFPTVFSTVTCCKSL